MRENLEGNSKTVELAPVKRPGEREVRSLLSTYEAYQVILRSGGPYATTSTEEERKLEQVKIRASAIELSNVLGMLGQREQVTAIDVNLALKKV